MEEKFKLIDYYIKNLDPDEQRGVTGDLRDKFNYMERKYILDIRNDYKNVLKKGLFKTVQDIESFLQGSADKFISINERMMKNERYPLFEDPYNLLQSMEWRDKLLEYMPESECNKIVGCKSFDDYEPPVYKKKMIQDSQETKDDSLTR